MCRSEALVNRNVWSLTGAPLAGLVAQADPAELGVAALQLDDLDGHGQEAFRDEVGSGAGGASTGTQGFMSWPWK